MMGVRMAVLVGPDRALRGVAKKKESKKSSDKKRGVEWSGWYQTRFFEVYCLID